MRTYELVLVLNSSLTSEKRKKLIETIKGWLKEAKITKEEDWGQKALAYPIKREKIGFYHLFSFEANTIPTDTEKRILSQDQVLRHLLVRTD